MPRTIGQEERIGYVFLLPVLIIIILLFFYPAVYNFWLSFQKQSIFGGQSTFVGIANYVKLVTQENFWRSLVNGLVYGIITTIFVTVLGLASAMVLNGKPRFGNVFAGLLMAPYVIPSVVVALIWSWLFNDMFGIVNHSLVVLGFLSRPVSFTGNATTAMATVIFVSVWHFFPLATLMILARLQTVPSDWYDAAEVDGASTWQRFIHVTLPELSGVILLVVLLRFIWIFNNFDIIWLITGGGPAGATGHLPILTYQTAFHVFDAGLASASAVVIFGILAMIYIIYVRLLKI